MGSGRGRGGGGVNFMSTCWLRQVKSLGESKEQWEQAVAANARVLDHVSSHCSDGVLEGRIGSVALPQAAREVARPAAPEARVRKALTMEEGVQ